MLTARPKLESPPRYRVLCSAANLGARLLQRVKSVMASVRQLLPQFTQLQTFRRAAPSAASRHFRLYAPQQKPDLFNHLVGALDLLRSP